MKINDIVDKYGFDKDNFKSFLKKSGVKINSSNLIFSSDTLDDNIVDNVINIYKKYLEVEKEKQERTQKNKEEKNNAIAKMLISSGFNFDGYRIVKYSGYISGDDVVQISRGEDGLFSGATDVGEALSQSLRKIRRQALAELKEAAYDLGCNAVIGVDFDYITLDPETANSLGGTTYLPYVFCVTANGNAVVIEKEE